RFLGWRLATTASVDPEFFVVLPVVHHSKNKNDARVVVHPADESEAVVAHVENNAIAYLVSRSKRLLESPEIGPVGILRYLVPDGQILFRVGTVMRPRLPKLPKPLLGNNAHVTPIGQANHSTTIIIAKCDKSSSVIAICKELVVLPIQRRFCGRGFEFP